MSFNGMTFYEAAFNIWNKLIGIAMTLFTTSPTSASGGVYALAKTCFDALKAISLPIAIVFFLLAIIKDVVGSPPEQQARKFLFDAIKFGVLVGIIANLWDIMGYVMQIADGITSALSVSGSYEMHPSSDLTSAANAIWTKKATWIDTSGMNLFEKIPAWLDYIPTYLEDWFYVQLTKIFLLIGGIGTCIMVVAAGMSIISSAFQRILKPLVILPFSTITIAMAAGSHEAERISTSYLKSFFGLCLSGAFMVICVKLGAAIMNSGLIAFDISSLDNMSKVIYLSIQSMITPMVISGLVKSADSMLSKFF